MQVLKHHEQITGILQLSDIRVDALRWIFNGHYISHIYSDAVSIASMYRGAKQTVSCIGVGQDGHNRSTDRTVAFVRYSHRYQQKALVASRNK
jgi:hypothetical protein